MENSELQQMRAQLAVLTELVEDLETRHDQRFEDLKRRFDHELARLRQRVFVLEEK